MVFICAILFTIVWWNVSHSRSNWLVMFIVLIILSVVAGIYAARGILRGSRRPTCIATSRRQNDSVVIGVRRRRDVGRVVDVVEL